MMHRTGKPPLPVGTVDTHFHLFGPACDYPYAPRRSYTPDNATMADYLAMARRLGIERAVIVQPSPYGTDNRRLLDGLAQSPIPIRGVAAVDATVSDDTLAIMHDAGVRAIRINVVFDAAAAVQTAIDLAPRLAEMGWHIQFLVDVSTWPDLTKTVEKLKIPSVFDHLGHIPVGLGTTNKGFQAMLSLLREGLAWVKASGLYRLLMPIAVADYSQLQPFFDAVVSANADRVVWATDWPHSAIKTAMPDDLSLAEIASSWLGSDETLRGKIFVRNAMKLYGF